MEIRKMKLSEIKPAPYNPRKDLKPGDPEYDKMRRSIDEFDCVEPLVWNKRTKHLVGGHQRLKVLKEKGVKEFEVSVVDLDEKREKALNVALNKIQGDWDFTKLADLITDLDDGEFNLELTGFDMSEIEELMNWTPKEEESFDAAAEADKIKEPKSKRGEIYRLGRHRVMCGDATSREDVESLMGGEKVGLCFTSPPYSDQRTYRGNKDLSTKHLAIFISVACDFVDFFCVNLGIKRKNGEIIEYWRDYIEAAKNAGMKIVSWNIWDKGRGGSVGSMTAMFPVEHEWIFVFGHKPKGLIPTIPNLTAGQKTEARIMSREGTYSEPKSCVKRDFGEIGTVIRCRQVDKNDKHPAAFPVELPKQYIKAFKSDCYDPFGGSGSTLIACEQSNRQCRMMEIGETYCDVIIARWEKLTGEKAELIKR